MFRLRAALTFAFLLVPAVALAQDKAQICSNVENHALILGSWAVYNFTGGQADGSTMRFAVVGNEPYQGKTYYWFEVKLDDPKRPRAGMVMQMLVPGLGLQASSVRSIIMKSGDQPAMRMPEQLVQAMASSLGSNVAADITRSCREMDLVGLEMVSVPAGSFRAQHLRHAREGIDAWIQTNLNFPMVKATMKDGGTMVLASQGTGAKSSITETPREMTGFPASPPD